MLINSYLAFCFLLFSLTTLLQLGVHRNLNARPGPTGTVGVWAWQPPVRIATRSYSLSRHLCVEKERVTNHKELARMPAWEAKFPVLMDQLFGLSGFRHVPLSKAKTFYVIVSWYKFHALVTVILLMVFMTKVRNVLTEAIWIFFRHRKAYCFLHRVRKPRSCVDQGKIVF